MKAYAVRLEARAQREVEEARARLGAGRSAILDEELRAVRERLSENPEIGPRAWTRSGRHPTLRWPEPVPALLLGEPRARCDRVPLAQSATPAEGIARARSTTLLPTAEVHNQMINVKRHPTAVIIDDQPQAEIPLFGCDLISLLD